MMEKLCLVCILYNERATKPELPMRIVKGKPISWASYKKPTGQVAKKENAQAKIALGLTTGAKRSYS